MKALITGSLGQDGSFLAEHLLKLGYEVYGTVRCKYAKMHANYVKGVKYIYADLTDVLSMESAIRKAQPDEIYNLAGQTFVPTSFEYPNETLAVNTGGLATLLQLVENMKKDAKVYQASTSEMFGNALQGVGSLALDESSPMHPISPYAVSKHASHELVEVYRQRGLFVVGGILFNHESERRGPEMVTRKITRHVARWKNGHKDILQLGAIQSKRDWGYAKDYVDAMHRMLQLDTPQDFVVGTGVAHSVYDVLVTALTSVLLDVEEYVALTKVNTPMLQRTPELVTLVADNAKAYQLLGWKPVTKFTKLIEIMLENDMREYSDNTANMENVCIKK